VPLAELDRKRQADIAEADNADVQIIDIERHKTR
jgi:hypothetical protein